MRRDRDAIGRLFARLTAEFEDACELAVEGQNPRLPLSRRSALALRLRNRLARTAETMDSIDAAIASHDEVGK